MSAVSGQRSHPVIRFRCDWSAFFGVSSVQSYGIQEASLVVVATTSKETHHDNDNDIHAMMNFRSSSDKDPLLKDDLSVSDYDGDLEDADMSDNEDDGTGMDNTNTASAVLNIRIKSFKDVTVTVKPSETVHDLKEACVAALGTQATDRYVRLIRHGRLLAPDSATLTDQAILDGDVVHAVLAAAGRQGAQAALASGGAAFHRRSWAGAGIDATGLAVRQAAPVEEEESDEETARNRAGFDRLRTDGMRRAEVTAIRSYFSRHVDRWIRQNSQAAEQAASAQQDPMQRRLLQEEAWMSAQGPTSEFRLNLAGSWQARQMMPGSQLNADLWRSGASASVGTDRDFLWGFMLGFFVGFLMLVWVWMPTVPHVSNFHRRTSGQLHLFEAAAAAGLPCRPYFALKTHSHTLVVVPNFLRAETKAGNTRWY